jgi:uncharacterized iron-regulated protein
MKYTIRINLFLLSIFCAHYSFSQFDQAYQLYDAKGKKIEAQQIKKEVLSSEIILFGEYHDNPISHWLQVEVMNILHEKYQEHVQIGFEMFERDQQHLLDDYVRGVIEEKQFKDSCRLWPNYDTDYAPILVFARKNKLTALATNIPRKYASLLFKKGRSSLDSLSNTEKAFMAPIDFKVDTSLSQYAPLKEMEQHMGGKHMLEAQAIKDATMAASILSYWKPGKVLLHLNGAYHSDFYQGILWYIKQSNSAVKVLTISTVSQAQISKLDKEHRGRADVIICVKENMTKTH